MSSGRDPVLAFQNLTPDQILDSVESNGRWRCDGRFQALNSFENRVYQLWLDDGEQVVAKFYRPERWADAAIVEEHVFTQSLSDEEIPVIPPLADSQGNTLFHDRDYRFSLYPCRGGRPPQLDSEDQIEQLGRFVGRMHGIARVENFSFRPQVNLQSYVIDATQVVKNSGYLPIHLEEAYETLIEDLTRRIRSCYERAGEVLSIRLHADLHAGNVLWTDDGPHVVDFDDARTGPAIQDLWMFLSGDRDYMQLMWDRLAAGYLQFCDFNPAELHLVEALRTMRLIYHAAWLASRWGDPAFPLAFPWFNEVSYWEKHILDLREQAALMDERPLDWNF
ncbi:MAG: serine/threonine protein kinase [Pseudomonadota bacterium]